MQVITQPNSWSCLPTAYAMCMDMPLAAIMDMLPHDGSALLRPDSEDSSAKNRIGFLTDELDVIALRCGWAPVTLAVDPRLSLDHDARPGFPTLSQLMLLSWPRNVVLTVESERLGSPYLHCVAHDSKTQYFHDPLTGIRPLTELPLLKEITIFFDIRSHYED